MEKLVHPILKFYEINKLYFCEIFINLYSRPFAFYRFKQGYLWLADMTNSQNAVPHLTVYHHITICKLSEKSLHIPLYENKGHDHGQYPCKVKPKQTGKTYPASSVGFRYELFPAPTLFMAAEKHEGQRTDGEQVITEKEVFQIHQVCPFAQRMDPGKNVESKNTGQSQNSEDCKVHPGGFPARPLPHIHTVGNDVLHHRDDSCQRRSAHKHKKQSPPEATAGHFIENIRQCNEHKPRTGTWLHIEGETGGKNDETRYESHECIETNDKQ